MRAQALVINFAEKVAMPANNTFERTVNHRGRIVLAMDCVLADAQWRWRPAAQRGRWRRDRRSVSRHDDFLVHPVRLV